MLLLFVISFALVYYYTLFTVYLPYQCVQPHIHLTRLGLLSYKASINILTLQVNQRWYKLWTLHLLEPLCPASLAKAGKMSPEVSQVKLGMSCIMVSTTVGNSCVSSSVRYLLSWFCYASVSSLIWHSVLERLHNVLDPQQSTIKPRTAVYVKDPQVRYC